MDKPTLTHCEVALLMLLTEGDMHPYQVEKVVRERDMRYWTELSMSSIYKTLRALERKGLVVSKAGLTERNVARKTCSLTPAGRTAVRDALLQYASEPERTRWRIDLATSHLGVLPRAKARDALRRYEEGLKAQLQGYRDLQRYMEGQGCAPHALALATRPQHLLRADLAWVRDYRARLGLEEKA